MIDLFFKSTEFIPISSGLKGYNNNSLWQWFILRIRMDTRRNERLSPLIIRCYEYMHNTNGTVFMQNILFGFMDSFVQQTFGVLGIKVFLKDESFRLNVLNVTFTSLGVRALGLFTRLHPRGRVARRLLCHV